jgi:hypothetical protein
MSNFKIVIPSYKRPLILYNKTLQILIDHGINPNIVYIFVADEEQLNIYRDVLPKEYKDRLVVAVAGMMNVRNFITDYFQEDDKLFNLDDDISEIYKKVNDELVPIDDLTAFINKGFQLCDLHGCNLFSIYPVANAYFMKNVIDRGLLYCMGGVWGNYNKRHLKVSVNDKEDFERSLIYFLDTYDSKDTSRGGVIRFNNVCCATKGYTGANSGMNAFDRSYNIILESANKIVDTYGKYCSLNLKKKSGKPEVRFKRLVLGKIVAIKDEF